MRAHAQTQEEHPDRTLEPEKDGECRAETEEVLIRTRVREVDPVKDAAAVEVEERTGRSEQVLKCRGKNAC